GPGAGGLGRDRGRLGGALGRAPPPRCDTGGAAGMGRPAHPARHATGRGDAMKITAVKLLRLRGTMEFEGKFWEERLVRPVDLYPEHASQGEQPVPQVAPGKYRMESIFLRIETDQDGLIGIGGPISHGVAYIIGRSLAGQLIGHDPLAIERIWDR